VNPGGFSWILVSKENESDLGTGSQRGMDLRIADKFGAKKRSEL
jgi:ribosomal protein L32E